MRNNVAAGSDVSENKWRRKFLSFLFINAFARTLIMGLIQHTCIIFYQYAGIWYVFPDEPIGASYGIVKTMQKDEAKRTPITEFTNNVVHSNRVVSISIHCTVGQMLQRIIHRRLTIKKALIDYNVEEKNLIQKNGNRETIFFLFVMIIGYKRNLHWFFSSFHLNHKYFKIRLKVYFK